MEHNEPQDTAGESSAKDRATEEPASDNEEPLSIDPATIPHDYVERPAEPLSEKEQKRALIRAARERRMEDENLGPLPTIDWKGEYMKTVRQLRVAREQVQAEKAVVENLRAQLAAAHQLIANLDQEIAEKDHVINLLDPNSKEARLEAELEGLRLGTIVPQGEASGSAIEPPEIEPPTIEPAAIQQLDDNMGIDSDEELDESAADDEGSEKADDKSDKGSIDHEDEPAKAKE